MRGEEGFLQQLVELWKDGEGRMIEVVRRCSYLCVEEVWDWVLSKEASNLEEGAGTICGSTLHKRRGILQRLYKSLNINTFPALAGH